MQKHLVSILFSEKEKKEGKNQIACDTKNFMVFLLTLLWNWKLLNLISKPVNLQQFD